MAIEVVRVGQRYSARVTPPHGGGVEWATIEPTEVESLISDLQAHGCHQTDIADALYEADPAWLIRLESAAE